VGRLTGVRQVAEFPRKLAIEWFRPIEAPSTPGAGNVHSRFTHGVVAAAFLRVVRYYECAKRRIGRTISLIFCAESRTEGVLSDVLSLVM
jgi:hypothetical protein